MTFAGSCNRNLFEMWLEQCLLPQLPRGDIIVIDNASFHHSQTIDEVVADAGCELWYLPPYSPDLNKIEHWWFVLKNWMRQRWNEFDSFHDCVDAAFKHCPNVFAQRYNSGRWIEVLDEQGEFLGAGRFSAEDIFWQEVPLNGDSFTTPSLPWVNDEVELGVTKPAWADDVNPMWSEEILTQYAVSIEENGTKIRYLMSGD